ncbi:MAG: ABC transporter permease [Steroidobacteraceae bacterium]
MRLSIDKIGWIAAREFIATVATRGFIIGLLVTPALGALFLYAAPRLLSPRNFHVAGDIAIVDPSGVVASSLRATVDPRNLETRRREYADRALASTLARRHGAGLGSSSAGAGNRNGGPLDAMAAIMTGPMPDLRVVDLPDGRAARTTWLVARASARRHLAVVVVQPHAGAAASTDPAPAYDLYLPSHLDSRTAAVIRRMLNDAVIGVRARAHGLDLDRLDAITRVEAGRTITVGANGAEHPAEGAFATFLPFALILMMLIGVFSGGQFLLTTMVEEKSSRIIEVLLSAVSPVELLAGKIAGQLGASLVGMSLYVLAALAALLAFALFGLLDPVLLLYLLLFFVLAFLIVGSVMVGVGAAVNEIRDAQSLLMPFMLLISAIWVLVFPLSMSPSSKLAVALSFTPIVSPFVMMVRVASSAPPPPWEVAVSVAVGIATVAAAVWFAAKIFRIALLLHGKPPNLATLLRWAISA